MSLDAEVGAGVELGGASLSALFGIAGTLDGIKQQLAKLHNLEESYQFGAIQVELGASASSDAAQDTFEIDLGGPSYGRLWQVRGLIVGGPLWSSTRAGTALVVVNSAQNLTPVLSDVVDSMSSLPAILHYSTSQLIVRHPNHLRIVIASPTASAQYVAGGGATDMPDKRERIEAGI